MTQQVLTRIYVELIQCLVPRFIINLHKHNHDDFLVLALPIGPHQRMTSLSLCPNEGERGVGLTQSQILKPQPYKLGLLLYISGEVLYCY